MATRTQVASDQDTGLLERRFAIRSRGSTVAREVLGGLATFLTLSYILFVQPPLMNAAAGATGGVSTASVLTAVCIASALACVVMGLLANFPVALAPAMGHNFFFAVTVCGTAVGAMHFTFQQALLANLIAGGIFLALSVLGMVVPRLDPRVLLFGAIPKSLQNAIGVGIGLLIALVGLEYAGVIVPRAGTGLGLGIGKVPWTPIVVAGVGLTVFGVLWARGVMGAPLWSIIASAVTGAVVGVVHMPERVAAMPVLSDSVLRPAQAGFAGLKTSDIMVVIATFLFLVVFDTVGTLAAVCRRAGLITPDGKMDKGVGAAFVADAAGTVAGAALGTSTITSYVESLAGIQVGARTGLSALVVAVLFVLAMFFAPLVGLVAAPYMLPGATSPVYPCLAAVLIGIGALMLSCVKEIDWEDSTEALPAFLCLIIMPLTLSITDGIAFGFISYVVLKVLSGRWRQVHPFIAVCAVLLAVRYAI